jgi:hypothetical protein
MLTFILQSHDFIAVKELPLVELDSGCPCISCIACVASEIDSNSTKHIGPLALLRNNKRLYPEHLENIVRNSSSDAVGGRLPT